TITVANTGNVDLTNVSVTDPFADAGSVQYVSGDTNNDNILETTETWRSEERRVGKEGEMRSGTALVKTKTGSGDGGAKEVTSTGTATTTVDQEPSIEVDKVADGRVVDAGHEVIHSTITVANTGNVDLTNVSVTDPFADAGSVQYVSGDTNNDNILETTETW